MEAFGKTLRKLVGAFMVLVLVAGSTGVHTVQADTDTDKDYELDLSGIEAWDTYNDAELTEFKSLQNGDITYTRTHVLATSGIHYETDHLIVSAKPLTYTGTITDDTPVMAGMGKEGGGASFSTVSGSSPIPCRLRSSQSFNSQQAKRLRV